MVNKRENFMKFDTLSIHAGHQGAEAHQAVSDPIYMTSSFNFTDMEQVEDAFSFKQDLRVYTRGGNPTTNLLERRLASLEGGSSAVAFASGMSAITTVLLSLAQQGETIVAHHTLYGSSYSALTVLFKKFGIKTKLIDLLNLDEFKKKLSKDIKVIFFETPVNPSLCVIDIEAISKIAQAKGIKVVVDNTFATPYLQQPLKLGADIVVHSATKYLSGHGDVVGGIATAKDSDYIASLKFDYMCKLGGVISPFNAWLILRGMKTLSIRMDRHQDNALAITEALQKNSYIEQLIHPSLIDHPSHHIAKKQMRGFGGMISFSLKGDIEYSSCFLSLLKLFKLSVSLGDAESLIQMPALMTHRCYQLNDENKLAFDKKTIRISAGLENAGDLIDDIDQALNKTY